ncbi:MAG: SDR family NAD(P)-dependent oxidoreductase [Solirubrobacterales bacterium]|nr:SDR family NAD(P)-dependent oxidoreductase [Solirubrobacterales bacterium]
MLLSATTALVKAAARQAAAITPLGPAVLGDRREPLDGRVVFITGAARGLGAELARQAHAEGARVALVGRRLEPLQALAAELGEDRAAAFHADVTDLDALGRAADGCAERFGRIDVVVANAGIAPPSDTILTIDPAAFEHTVDVDLLGQWRTMRATFPHLVNSRGHILVVASIYAFFNGAMNASYAASKAGTEQLARAARVELAHHGATAGIAYLGFVQTDLAADVFAQQSVAEARQAVPAFLTAPIPVEQAAAALLDGIERRAGRVGAPGWVLPMLAVRGVTTTLIDTVMLNNSRLSAAIARAETNKDPELRPRDLRTP